jgi:hypothetical protein
VGRKILKLLLLLEDDTEPLCNMSEVHLQRIMNTKIGPETPYMMRDERSQAQGGLTYASLAVVKENLSKPAKMFESCLYSDSVSPQYVMTYFVQSSRQILQTEVSRQQTALEGNFGVASVMMNKQRKSKTCLPPIHKSSATLKRSSGGTESEWKINLVRMLMDRNADIDRRIKQFAKEYRERHPNSLAAPKGKLGMKSGSVHVAKSLRARNYEKKSTTLPVCLKETDTMLKLQEMPDIFLDVDNPYFDESSSIAQRIQAIHSCVIIQRAFLSSKYAKVRKAAVKIQSVWRGFRTRRDALYRKVASFRRAYFSGRLLHWLPLLANKFREKKETRHFDAGKYVAYVSYIRKIQKVARGYLARKATALRRSVRSLHKKPENVAIYSLKRKFWRATVELEARTLANSSHTSQDSGSARNVKTSYSKGNRGVKEIQSLMTKLERSESEYRKKITEAIKEARLVEL